MTNHLSAPEVRDRVSAMLPSATYVASNSIETRWHWTTPHGRWTIVYRLAAARLAFSGPAQAEVPATDDGIDALREFMVALAAIERPAP